LQVCAKKISDDTSIINENQKKRIISETQSAITEWEQMLKNSDRTNQEMWDVDTRIFESDESFPVNCQIKIVFSPSRGDAKTLGIAFMNNTGIADIEIYYQQINYCQKTWTDEKYRYIENYACYSNSAFTTQEIGATIRHEFGHALGLAHYPLGTKLGSISSSPSIMVAHSWETVHMSRITQYDIDSVKKIHPEGIASLIFKPTENKSVSESLADQFTSVKQSVPSWIKNNAKWWANDIIDDQTFVSGIQFLINENIIQVDSKEISNQEQKIPSWIKNNAKWWADDIISDDDFLSGVKYLVNNGIINVK
jgi:predicted Zn-dependent protease